MKIPVSAIDPAAWDEAATDERIPGGAPVDVGVRVGWVWDTTALVPLWRQGGRRVLGAATALTPPRDCTVLSALEVWRAFETVLAEYAVRHVVMDVTSAADVATWLEDEGVVVVDHARTNAVAADDYDAFTGGLRTGALTHVGDSLLRDHVLRSVARPLPGGRCRFARPRANHGDRSIDALTAAAAVVEVFGS